MTQLEKNLGEIIDGLEPEISRGETPFRLGDLIEKNNPMTNPEEIIKEFDEKFGAMDEQERENYDDNDYDKDRVDSAGCDGCDYNVWWREQIRQFIKDKINDTNNQ